MTQENKELLLKDLCARLPYGVKILHDGWDYDRDCEFSTVETLIGINDRFIYTLCGDEKDRHSIKEPLSILDYKPYLFPLLSMTEEQRIELYKVLGWGYESHYHLSKEWEDLNDSIDNNDLFLPASWISDLNKIHNWLNKNHFDYQGLIKKGLALSAIGLNIY